MKLTPTSANVDTVDLDAAEDNVILGRMPRRGVKIEHQTVSREHARLFLRDGQWQVADLNSSNGTFLNDRKVTRGSLNDGDLLRFGDLEFRVELVGKGGDVPAADPPAADPSGAGASAPRSAATVGAPQPSEADIFGEGSPTGDDADDDGIVLEDPASEESAPEATATQPLADQTLVVPPRPMFHSPPPGPAAGASRPKALEHMALKSRGKEGGGGSLLKQEVGQHGVMRQALIVIVVLAISAALFYFVMQVTEQVVPEGGIPDAATGEDS